MRAALVLLAGVGIAAILGGEPAAVAGWSLFGDSSTTEKTPINPYTGPKKEPSALDKATTGTKKFFTGISDTVTGKKTAAPKKPTNQYTPWMNPKSQPQPEKKSWFSSMFKSKEPEQPKTPSQWINQKRPDY